MLCILFAAWARSENKPRWGDKTPQYITELPLILGLFPNAQILHIIRDGRDVAASAVKAAFEGNLFTAALRWKADVQAGRLAGARLSASTYCEIGYEELLENPEASMKRVCAFLEEPWDPCVLKPTPPKPHALSTAPWWLVPPLAKAEIDRANRTKWVTALRTSDRILFESLAGDLLKDLGYVVEGRTRPVRSFEHWVWHCHDRMRYVNYRMLVLRRPDLLRNYVHFRLADLLWKTRGLLSRTPADC